MNWILHATTVGEEPVLGRSADSIAYADGTAPARSIEPAPKVHCADNATVSASQPLAGLLA